MVVAALAGCADLPGDEPVGRVSQALLPCTSATGYVSGVARTICVATVDGKPFAVHLQDGMLLFQLPGTVKEDVAIVIRP